MLQPLIGDEKFCNMFNKNNFCDKLGGLLLLDTYFISLWVCDCPDVSDKLSGLIIYYDLVAGLLSISWVKIKQVDFLFAN